MEDEKYVFQKVEGGEPTVAVVSKDETWPDVAERFFEFLRGCGFYLDRQDLSDYFNEGD